jgi:hypothetical protein
MCSFIWNLSNSCQISNESFNKFHFSHDFNVLHLPDFSQFCSFFFLFVRIFIFGKVRSLIKVSFLLWKFFKWYFLTSLTLNGGVKMWKKFLCEGVKIDNSHMKVKILSCPLCRYGTFLSCQSNYAKVVFIS